MKQKIYNVSLLVGSSLITKFSDKILLISLMWYVTYHYDKHWLTLLLIFSALPHLIFVFVSGRVIRYFSPLKTMISSDYFRMCLFGIMWLLLMEGLMQPVYLVASFFIANIAAAFFNPAMLTLPVSMVGKDQLQRVMSMLTSTNSFSRIIGPVCAVFLYRFIGFSGVFLGVAIAYGIAATMECFIRGLDLVSPVDKPAILEPWSGLLKRYRFIAQLLSIFFMINIVLVPLQLFIPLYSQSVIGGGMHSLSMMEMSIGIGALSATILLSIVNWRSSMRIKTFLPYFAMGIAFLVFGLSQSLIIACAALLVLGFCSTVGNIITVNVFQQYPNEQDVPSVMAWVNFTSTAAAPIGYFVAGIGLHYHALHWQVAIYACIGIVLTMVIGLLRGFSDGAFQLSRS